MVWDLITDFGSGNYSANTYTNKKEVKKHACSLLRIRYKGRDEKRLDDPNNARDGD